jgi:hypothetical protein
MTNLVMGRTDGRFTLVHCLGRVISEVTPYLTSLAIRYTVVMRD